MDRKHRPLLKQIGDLRPADFEAHPLWVLCHIIDYDEPWYDDPDVDEGTVRPWLGCLPVDPTVTSFLLPSAEFTLRDDTRLNGFLFVLSREFTATRPEQLGRLQPFVFLPSGRVEGFWSGIATRAQDVRDAFYQELRKNPEDVFSIRFRACHGLLTVPITGEIPGFCCEPLGSVVKVLR